MLLTAYHTPGHTRGATTWVANLVVDGKAYVVVFPDGAGFNPGYRLAKNPIYPGIADDFRRTHHLLEMLKPDIWLAQHNEYYDLEGKRERAQDRRRQGMDRSGRLSALHRRRRNARSRTRSTRNWAWPKARRNESGSEDLLRRPEPGCPARAAAHSIARCDGSGQRPQFRPRRNRSLFRQDGEDGAFGKLRHRRTMASIDAQDVVRMNRDTLYSSGVFDLDAAPLTVTLPDAGKRFMSMQVISQDHYTTDGRLRARALHLHQEQGRNALCVRHHPHAGQFRKTRRT